MRTLRAQLIVSHLLPALIVVPLAALALIALLERQLIRPVVTQNLQSQAQILAATTSDRVDLWTDPQVANRYLAPLNAQLDGRVLLLTADRRIWAASAASDQARIGQPADAADVPATIATDSPAQVSWTWSSYRAIVLVSGGPASRGGSITLIEDVTGDASPFERVRWIIIAVLLAELALGIVLALLLAQRLGRPISRAVSAIGALADGQVEEPLPLEGPREMQRLASSVNTLSARLQALEQERRRSLANIVHELGRPLGAVRSAVHVLRHGAGDDPAIRSELLAGIDGELGRMEPLLDDLTQLQSQALGTMRLALQPVVVSDWLNALLPAWRSAAQAKGLTWQAEIPPDLPAIEIDPNRLGQAVGNLLSNAIRYTPAGGQVTVTATATDKELRIAVADTGPGIAPAEQAQIFEPFFRSARAHRFPQGLGIGLTIARDLVIAHGGTIELSTPARGGSCFTVHLPL